MTEDSAFHPDAFHHAVHDTPRRCAGCHLPLPQFLAAEPTRKPQVIQARIGRLTLEDLTGKTTYEFYNECRHHLRELADLHSSPDGCPSCGSTDHELTTAVSIHTGPHLNGAKTVSTSVCEDCAESLHARGSTPVPPEDNRDYCIPEWLTVPPWQRDVLTFTSGDLSPDGAAPSPPNEDSATDLGATKARSVKVRKAFHELLDDCCVTIGIYEYAIDDRPAQYLTIRGLVEDVDRTGRKHQIILSVGDASGWLITSEQSLPARVIFTGRLSDEDNVRGAEKYEEITGRVEAWRDVPGESRFFESLLGGYVTGLQYRRPHCHDYSVSVTAPIMGYPPEPTPPASVTELSTVFFEDGRLSVDLGASEKQWVAKLTGTSHRYRFSKEWVAYARPGRDSGIVSGAMELDNGAFVEIGWDSTDLFRPPEEEYASLAEYPYRIRRYFQVREGDLVECSREEAEEELE